MRPRRAPQRPRRKQARGGAVQRAMVPAATALSALLLFPAGPAADGKMFAREAIPSIPFQRALVHFQDGRQLLVVQSSFTGDPGELAWVVPCPSVPQVGALASDRFFFWLDREASPSVLPLGVLVGLVFFAGGEGTHCASFWPPAWRWWSRWCSASRAIIRA